MPARDATARGLVLVNLAVALFGLAGVLGQMTGLPSPLVVLGRAAFGALALLAITRLAHVPLRLGRADSVLLVGQGLLLALHWTTFFQSIAVAGVAVGLLSFTTFPLFTAALEPILLGSVPSRVQVIAALCMAVGVGILAPAFSLDSVAVQGILWGLTAAMTFALLTVLNRRAGRTVSSLVVSLYQNSVAAMVLMPALLIFDPQPLWQPDTLLILVILGVCCTAVAHTAFIAGLQQMTAQLASLLAGLEPVWGIALGVVMLGEIPSARSLAGGAMIVGAAMLPALHAYLTRLLVGPARTACCPPLQPPDDV